MDSLTQIVLGASVAEAALGKKIGNRAMIWGAIAGTIPDLDVLSNFFLSPIEALAFHRGITHSLVFEVVLGIIMGFTVKWLYAQHWHRWAGIIGWSLVATFVVGLLIYRLDFSWKSVLVAIFVLGLAIYIIFKRYFRSSYTTPEAHLTGWIWMFALALVTHPILDSFTTYGTQILLPFTDMRVAFNNIAVVDFFYTIPFLICVWIASRFDKNNIRRSQWNYAGLAISSLYMLLTIYNKIQVDHIFESSLDEAGVRYERYMTSPSLMTNILWSGVAETDTSYVFGSYSFFDTETRFLLHTIKKDRANLNDQLNSDSTLKTLRWFSDDYYIMERESDQKIKYYDLRFGAFKLSPEQPEKFMFNFDLEVDGDGNVILLGQNRNRKEMDVRKVMKVFIDRIAGI
ncbi:MAG: metal-dependent hydrolase [Saprospiraceae bacterium]|nr:MAG: membrane-bound metal-dependent hydrolase [Bacteroidetes bacterium OLB9]MCO6462653.1 metal-dependent hydrolase [Saprospiraceae bacterium]MCZ2337030.1 metal-dependent hydrolase [Chitinophagales bacterium]